MALLALTMRAIPAGTAYAIWTGLGAVGVIIGGMILFGDKVNSVQAGFMAMIVADVAGTKLFGLGGGAGPEFGLRSVRPLRRSDVSSPT